MRGEKESRELKRTGERPSKVSTVISLSLALSLSLCVCVCVCVCVCCVWVCMCVSHHVGRWWPAVQSSKLSLLSPLPPFIVVEEPCSAREGCTQMGGVAGDGTDDPWAQVQPPKAHSGSYTVALTPSLTYRQAPASLHNHFILILPSTCNVHCSPLVYCHIHHSKRYSFVCDAINN